MRLREIRRAKGISQLKLAMDLNMNQNSISRYETGGREPGINELIQIADYFNVSVDYLLGRTSNPNMHEWAEKIVGSFFLIYNVGIFKIYNPIVDTFTLIL